MTVTPIESGDDLPIAAVVQRGGKFVVAGYSINGSNKDWSLARYTSSGFLDTSVGTGGIAIVRIGGFEAPSTWLLGICPEKSRRVGNPGDLHADSATKAIVIHRQGEIFYRYHERREETG